MGMTFADRLKQARRASGKTQRYLAEALGVSVQAVSQWENGQVEIQQERITGLAKALQVDSRWLSDGEQNEDLKKSESIIRRDKSKHFGNVVAGVLTLDEIPKTYRNFNDKKLVDFDLNASTVIYVDDEAFLRPCPIRIEKNDLSPNLVKGDVAIFDVGLGASAGDIVLILVSPSGVFHFGESDNNTEPFVAAIAKLGMPGAPIGSEILIGGDIHGSAKSKTPAFMILGPMTERRTYPRRSSEPLDKLIK